MSAAAAGKVLNLCWEGGGFGCGNDATGAVWCERHVQTRRRHCRDDNAVVKLDGGIGSRLMLCIDVAPVTMREKRITKEWRRTMRYVGVGRSGLGYENENVCVSPAAGGWVYVDGFWGGLGFATKKINSKASTHPTPTTTPHCRSRRHGAPDIAFWFLFSLAMHLLTCISPTQNTLWMGRRSTSNCGMFMLGRECMCSVRQTRPV